MRLSQTSSTISGYYMILFDAVLVRFWIWNQVLWKWLDSLDAQHSCCHLPLPFGVVRGQQTLRNTMMGHPLKSLDIMRFDAGCRENEKIWYHNQKKTSKSQILTKVLVETGLHNFVVTVHNMENRFSHIYVPGGWGLDLSFHCPEPWAAEKEGPQEAGPPEIVVEKVTQKVYLWNTHGKTAEEHSVCRKINCMILYVNGWLVLIDFL